MRILVIVAAFAIAVPTPAAAFVLDDLLKGTGDHFTMTNPRSVPPANLKGVPQSRKSSVAKPDRKLQHKPKASVGPKSIDDARGSGAKSGYKFELNPHPTQTPLTSFTATAKPITKPRFESLRQEPLRQERVRQEPMRQDPPSPRSR
jgi:hypothetical protein